MLFDILRYAAATFLHFDTPPIFRAYDVSPPSVAMPPISTLYYFISYCYAADAS